MIIRFEGRARGVQDDLADSTAGDVEVHVIPERLVAVARVDQLIPGERLYESQARTPIEGDHIIPEKRFQENPKKQKQSLRAKYPQFAAYADRRGDQRRKNEGCGRHPFTHIAIQEQLDGKAVDWMEHVTDEQCTG